MKIICLAENTSKYANIDAEHGLSLYIEVNGMKILFDMGQTDLFSINAKKLGVDLSNVDIAVLSHGHYDHGGGIETFLSLNSKAPVYINEHAFGEYYNGTEKYIGLDKKLKDNKRIVFTKDFCKINDYIELLSCNERPRKNTCSCGLNKWVEGQLVPDDFLHEQYMLIKENDRNVLISGCSHKGILDITEWFCPEYLIGGFHLSKFPLDGRLNDYASSLNKFNTKFFTCHCTGEEQYEYMKEYMTNLSYIGCGDVVEI